MGLPLPFRNIKYRGNHAFSKVIDLFWKLLRFPLHFFPVTSPVSKTFVFLRAHYAICRYMFAVGFKCNFRKITARCSAGRCKQLVISDTLPFWSSWFKYRFIKIDLFTIGKSVCFNFTRVLGGVVDCVNVNPSAPTRLNHGLRDAQNVCALTK